MEKRHEEVEFLKLYTPRKRMGRASREKERGRGRGRHRERPSHPSVPIKPRPGRPDS